MDYRYDSQTVYQIEYHFVWVTKYRYKVLRGEVAERVRELVCQTCEAFEIRIVRGVVSKDHVHILVSAPPNLAPSEIMRRIKGRTASYLFEQLALLHSVWKGIYPVTAGAKGLAGRFSSLPVVRKMMWVRLRKDLKPLALTMAAWI